MGGAYPYGATPLKLRNLAQKMDKEELYVADDVGISKKSENFENSDDDVAKYENLRQKCYKFEKNSNFVAIFDIFPLKKNLKCPKKSREIQIFNFFL